MAKKADLKAETRDEMIMRLRAEGQTWKAIGEAVGLHPITVADVFTRLNEQTVKVKATAARVQKDRERGLSWYRIAVKYGTTKAAVKKLVA